MLALQVLAKNGRSIVATIHQPRSNIYTMFDKLLLLSKGKTMYFGPRSEAVQYFSSIKYPCPEAFNPADFFVDLISTDNRSPELQVRTGLLVFYLVDCSGGEREVAGRGTAHTVVCTALEHVRFRAL